MGSPHNYFRLFVPYIHIQRGGTCYNFSYLYSFGDRRLHKWRQRVADLDQSDDYHISQRSLRPVSFNPTQKLRHANLESFTLMVKISITTRDYDNARPTTAGPDLFVER